MKKFKKVATSAFAVAMAASMLVGCGKTTDGADEAVDNGTGATEASKDDASADDAAETKGISGRWKRIHAELQA